MNVPHEIRWVLGSLGGVCVQCWRPFPMGHVGEAYTSACPIDPRIERPQRPPPMPGPPPRLGRGMDIYYL